MRGEYGTSDDMASIGRAIVEGINGLRTALVDVAEPQSPGSFQSVGPIANATAFTVPLTGDLVEINALISCVTGPSILQARFTQGGVPVAGATDYNWANNQQGAATRNAGAGDSLIQICTDMISGNGAQFNFRFDRPGNPNLRKYMSWTGTELATPGLSTIQGGARLAVNVAAIDGIQFFFSGGALVLAANYTVSYRSVTV